jgi:hypothetical protein
MVASANDYRRKRGLPEVTLEDFERRAASEQRRLIREAQESGAT